MSQERMLRFHIERDLKENPEMALAGSKDLLSQAQASGDRELYGAALEYMGKAYLGLKQLDLADRMFDESYKVFKFRENHEQMSSVLNARGAVWQMRKDKKKAISYYFASVQEARKSKNSAIAYKPLYNLALIYQSNGTFETALNYIKQAITVVERWNLEEPRSRIYHIAALLYEEQKDIVQSRVSCIEAIRYAEKENNYEMYATATLTLATLELKMNRGSQAEKLMKALLQYDQNHGLDNNEVLCSIELVKLWFQTGNNNAAFTLLQKQVKKVRGNPKHYSPKCYVIFKLVGDYCRFIEQDIDAANRYYRYYLSLTKGVWKNYLED